MKKLMYILAFAAVAALVVLGTGCSGADKFHVYQISSSDADYTEYDIVYYDTRSNYKNEVLTGYVDETHYLKSGWTYEEVQTVTNDVYPGIENMSFVSTSITDEGDYYCCIVKFDDLDKVDNLDALHSADVLFSPSTSSTSSSGNLVDAEFFGQSITLQGGVEVAEDKVDSLGLHFNKK